jgi:hypothetical protein
MQKHEVYKHREGLMIRNKLVAFYQRYKLWILFILLIVACWLLISHMFDILFFIFPPQPVNQ